MNRKWPDIKFGSFLEINVRPYTLGPAEDADLVGMRLYGQGPFHRELKSAMQIVKKSHFVVRSGDIIFNKLFAWKGTFGIIPDELDGMFVSDKFPTYKLNREKVYDRYLYWYFRCSRVWEQARLLSTGSAALSKLTLNPPKFLLLTLPTPPLEEQRGVVARIESLAADIEKARTIRLESIMQAETILFRCCEKFLNDLEPKHPCLPLIDLVDQDRGICYGIVQTGTQVDGGVRTLRAGDLNWFACNTKDIKQVDPSIECAYQRTRLCGGELLLRIRGGVGEVAVCPTDLGGGNVSREIAVIPLLEHVHPQYAMFLMAAPTIQARLSGHIRGTSYVGINLSDVRNIRIPVPSLGKQQIIAEQLTEIRAEVDRLKALQAETAAEIDALLPAILDRAFKGELLR